MMVHIASCTTDARRYTLTKFPGIFYQARRGCNCINLLDNLLAVLKNSGLRAIILSAIRSDKRLRELRALTKERTERLQMND